MTKPALLRWVLVALVAGCAGESAEKKPSTVEGQGEAMQTAAGGGVTPEQNDAIDAVFRRKAQQLQSCWQDEYERNHNRALQGDVTVGLTVKPSGKPANVRVLKSSLGNPEIEACVVQSVSTWGFPEVGADCPYMRTVHLGAQF
jgi:TonB family protein